MEGNMTIKQAVKAAVFLAGFLFILVTVTYIIRTNGGVKDRFTGFYAEKENTIDVIMAGSSPVYPYYSAPKLYGEQGIVSYPLSTNNQRPKAIKYLFKEALKTQDPSLFIVELRMFTMPDEEWEDTMAFTRGVTDNMKYSVNRIQAINALVSDKSERYTYYFDIFKYHSNWKTMVMPEQLACWNYEKAHPLKGLEIKTGVGPAEQVDLSGVTGTKEPAAEQVEVLYDLLDWIGQSGKDALFLISPYAMEEDARLQYNWLISAIEEKGYPVLDFNAHAEEMGLDFATDFYDYGSHVNALGERKCTEFLGRYLDEHYDLPDRRGQKGYESWDDAFALYEDQQAKAEASCLADIENENWAPEVVED